MIWLIFSLLHDFGSHGQLQACICRFEVQHYINIYLSQKSTDAVNSRFDTFRNRLKNIPLPPPLPRPPRGEKSRKDYSWILRSHINKSAQNKNISQGYQPGLPMLKTSILHVVQNKATAHACSVLHPGKSPSPEDSRWRRNLRLWGRKLSPKHRLLLRNGHSRHQVSVTSFTANIFFLNYFAVFEIFIPKVSSGFTTIPVTYQLACHPLPEPYILFMSNCFCVFIITTPIEHTGFRPDFVVLTSSLGQL